MPSGDAKAVKTDSWRASDQKLRWCGGPPGSGEAHFRRVKGYEHLLLLEKALLRGITDVHPRCCVSASPRSATRNPTEPGTHPAEH
jgi:hypothetical protein